MLDQPQGIPSPELRKLLRDTFGVKKPKTLKDPAGLPIHDDAPKDKPRSVGNVMLSAEAQRAYNPGMPPTGAQPIKQPNAQQAKQGTAPAMDSSGPWGKPGGAD
jgi:hypothetical protein